jgi:hypothetical protein
LYFPKFPQWNWILVHPQPHSFASRILLDQLIAPSIFVWLFFRILPIPQRSAAGKLAEVSYQGPSELMTFWGSLEIVGPGQLHNRVLILNRAILGLAAFRAPR